MEQSGSRSESRAYQTRSTDRQGHSNDGRRNAAAKQKPPPSSASTYLDRALSWIGAPRCCPLPLAQPVAALLAHSACAVGLLRVRNADRWKRRQRRRRATVVRSLAQPSMQVRRRSRTYSTTRSGSRCDSEGTATAPQRSAQRQETRGTAELAQGWRSGIRQRQRESGGCKGDERTYPNSPRLPLCPVPCLLCSCLLRSLAQSRLHD
jgi:hypothetical protein